MDKKISLVTGIILIALGIAFFLDRGFFANMLLGADVLGNMGLWADDVSKVNGIAVFGGLAFTAGVVLTISGILKK